MTKTTIGALLIAGALLLSPMGCSDPTDQHASRRDAPVDTEQSSSDDASTDTLIEQPTGPFGLHMGMSRSDIEEAIGSPIQPLEPYLFRTDRVPRQPQGMDFFVLRVMPESGLCQIRVASEDISSSSHGVELKGAYENLRDTVANSYGTYGQADFLRSGSIWDEPEDWMMALRREERVLQAAWDRGEGSSMKNGVKQILLSARASSRSEGYLALQYQFDNEDACSEEADNAAKRIF